MAKSAGASLRASIIGALPPGVELDERELTMLDAAAAQADDIAALEADIAERGMMVPGRDGPRVNPAATEVRLGRTALGRLLATIELPDGLSLGQLHGKRAAEARWS